MNKTLMINIILFTSVVLISSCATTVQNNVIEKYCGYEMKIDEVDEISSWSSQVPDVYQLKNGSEIYEEVNDSIRNNLPDTSVFELFLIKLTDDEVVIDAYVPKDNQFIKDVACAYMNTKFSNLIPKNRKIRIYSYSNSDGSGDSPFEIGIKNKN